MSNEYSQEPSSAGDWSVLVSSLIGSTWSGAEVDDDGYLSVNLHAKTPSVFWGYTSWRISQGTLIIASDYDDDPADAITLQKCAGRTLLGVDVDAIANSVKLTFDGGIILETFTSGTWATLWEWVVGDKAVWADAEGVHVESRRAPGGTPLQAP